MKKNRNYIWIISIMLIAIFMMPIKAQADPDPRYWHWITSNDEFGYFVSTKKPTKDTKKRKKCVSLHILTF